MYYPENYSMADNKCLEDMKYPVKTEGIEIFQHCIKQDNTGVTDQQQYIDQNRFHSFVPGNEVTDNYYGHQYINFNNSLPRNEVTDNYHGHQYISFNNSLVRPVTVELLEDMFRKKQQQVVSSYLQNDRQPHNWCRPHSEEISKQEQVYLSAKQRDGAHKADLSEDVSMIMAGTGMLATNLLFAYKVKKWNSLMGKVADSPEMRNIQNFEAIKKRCNRLARLFTMYCVIGAGIYLLSGYYESLVCIRKNEENSSNEICRTLMPVWLPFRLSSAAELTLFALQAFAGINLSLPGANMPFLVWEITEMISLRISHLKKISESIVVEKNIKSRQERLKHWVMSHQQIIECISLLNEQVRLCFGHISTIAALVLGCLANQAINSVHLGAMAELGGWMVGLFLLCSSGQKITDITESVAEAIYAMEWYSTDVQTMRDIRFILMRSQKPLVLQAGPLGALNYPLYMMMVKASYTYLTLLANTI